MQKKDDEKIDTTEFKANEDTNSKIIETDNKEKKIKKHTFKNSIWMYCLIGFTVGVLLAAITIIIGSFV